jgi:hypothetical protein
VPSGWALKTSCRECSFWAIAIFPSLVRCEIDGWCDPVSHREMVTRVGGRPTLPYP